MTSTYEAFLDRLSKPSRSALLFESIDSFQKLATYTEKEILAIHGIGPKSLPIMKEALLENHLTFK
ncbi:hypothetical protein [Enterococcus olivae]